MQIVETNLTFKGGLSVRRVTSRAIVHHSASDTGNASVFHQAHLNNGWSGLGYHFVILKDGTIQRGRPEMYIGAHAGANGNPDSIGICLVGNFMNYEPSDAQLQSLVWLINTYLKQNYGKLNVIGHKDVMATACPGAKFPWTKLKDMLKGEVKPMPEKWKTDIINQAAKAGLIDPNMGHQPDEPATKWFVLAVCLNLLKILRK